jgi:hypothetical protein
MSSAGRPHPLDDAPDGVDRLLQRGDRVIVGSREAFDRAKLGLNLLREQ